MSNFWEGELNNIVGGVGGPSQKIDFSYMIDGKITNIGFHPKSPEGGLTIDFYKDGKPHRTVFGYNELGLWIQWQGIIGAPSDLDLLTKRIKCAIESDDWGLCDLNYDTDTQAFYFISPYTSKNVLTITKSELEILPNDVKHAFKIQDKEDRMTQISITLSLLYD